MRMHILPICFCTCVILGGAHTEPAPAALPVVGKLGSGGNEVVGPGVGIAFAAEFKEL
ncbi:MAG: hypothetical protein QF773_07740 [Lentisphaeria bacterium]|nr:hypothetical protein [Lentisphaeria bacterium]